MTTTKTRSRPWISRVMTALETRLHADHKMVSGEDVRNWLSAHRYRKPEHHNAYGALIRLAVQRGILMPTGRFKRVVAAQSRGRITPVYRVAKPRIAA